ncbi:undecaprenyl-phosphate glucose phosphotransferase [Pontibacter amylolyticus]|uniref:undecaprenyl-phosphate glucose phosphotransferase n=1 Tax=Pontibacter amylolyticus TaxID=1424080 RepID=UPI001662B329|nr:undecaprenyl-phosphate glucose phosphotransferase [Pontibacter amylolyticus]
MANKYITLFKGVNLVGDYLLLNLILYGCLYMAYPNTILFQDHDFRVIVLLLNLSWFFCSNVFGVYDNILKRDALPTITANVATIGLNATIVLSIKLVLPNLEIPFLILVSFLIIFSVAAMAWRTSFLMLRKYSRKFWIKQSKMIIIGASPSGIDLYNYIVDNPQMGYDIQGIFDDEAPANAPHLNYLGAIDYSVEYCRANGIQEIYCALPPQQKTTIEWLLEQADKHMFRFRIVPDLSGPFSKNLQVQLYGYTPVLIHRQEPLDDVANEVVKRAFDILFSSLVVIFLLSWLVPLMTIIIKLDSKGPVFFKQLRSGRNNKPFYCYKFRSMAPNKDSDLMQASKNDMRITRVGKFIRRTSIDELPQFFNVLLGDMSVVGPRPHMLKHTEDYSLLINNYMVRHFLTPGITGWAQVNGHRGETKETASMINRVQADLWYLEHWSLLLDLKIVYLTLWKMINKDENAY